MTLVEAKDIRVGDILFHKEYKNADGTPQRWKVTSVKNWKRNPLRIQIGLKRGIYQFEKIDESYLDEFFV